MPPISVDPATPRQVIPRPVSRRDGRPSLWAELGEEQRRGITLHQARQAVVGRPKRSPTGVPDALMRSFGGLTVPGRPAAVLLPLFEEDGETRVILTVRSGRLRSHQGEVAFPGGRIDPGEGVVECALREAHEEVGLDPGLVEVIGRLTPTPTATSNMVVTPVVGLLESRATPVANPDEVDRVFDVALADLAADGVFHEEWWSAPGRSGLPEHPGGEFPVWFFDVAGETVWGVTARTLVELVCLVLGVADPLVF